MPLCLVESARDVGQEGKPTTVLRELAQIANVVAICVLYAPDGTTCTCKRQRRDPRCTHGVSKFRFRRIYPINEPFATLHPYELAAWLTSLHDNHEQIACRHHKAG